MVAVKQDVLVVVERYLCPIATAAMVEDYLLVKTVTRATWRWRCQAPAEELVDFLVGIVMKMMARPEWKSQKVQEGARTRVGLLAMTRTETTEEKVLLDDCSELLVRPLVGEQNNACKRQWNCVPEPCLFTLKARQQTQGCKTVCRSIVRWRHWQPWCAMWHPHAFMPGGASVSHE